MIAVRFVSNVGTPEGQAMTPDYLERLARYDTATICNVIELFEVRPDSVGFMDARIRAAFPELAPMVGNASTATFRSSDPPTTANIYSDLDQQLQEMAAVPGPAVVAFQDLDDPPVGATFGEIMCSVYQSVGAVGLITSGAGRDLQAIRKLKFPVFIGSTICSHACSHIVDVGRTVRIGGLVIHNGDLLHGDADGITNIPIEIATEVADVAPEFIAAERILLDVTQTEGRKTIGELMERRRAVSDAIARLRQRVALRRR